jgi:hypothetical protein
MDAVKFEWLITNIRHFFCQRHCVRRSLGGNDNGPVEDDALAVCDTQSVGQSDLIATDLIYADRAGEFYNLIFKPEHRWYHFPRMRREEALIFKCFDSSDSERANCVPHSSFHDPEAPANAAPRESIEARTVAFY